MSKWTLDSIGDQSGKSVVVTGANSGVGFYTSVALAAAGAHVIMGCRNLKRSQDALAEVRAAGTGSAELRELDLADLDSVSAFAQHSLANDSKIDVLINNAGIMGGAQVQTAQGFESQMGTNFLGHFALTAQLFPLLLAAAQARVVSLSSLAARQGSLSRAITRDVLVAPERYSAYSVYSNTKQAMLLFASELARRAALEGLPISSIGVHPGVSASNLFSRQLSTLHLGFLAPVVNVGAKVALQSAEAGAQPSLMAATDPAVTSGSFIGPTGISQFRGSPGIIPLYRTGNDQPTAMLLWELAQEVTGQELLADI